MSAPPSIPQGLGSLVPYLETALLIRQTGQLLRLPSRALSLALIYLHVYKQKAGPTEGPKEPTAVRSDEVLAAACLFTAAKTEEVSLSNNHLVNAMRATKCAATARGPPWMALCASPDDLEEQMRTFEVLVGDSYYQFKTDMLLAEQCLLRCMRFQLRWGSQSAGAIAIQLCRKLGASEPLVQATLALLHDVCTLTTLFVETRPLQLAVAAIHVASTLLDCPRLPAAGGEALHPDCQHRGEDVAVKGRMGEDQPWGREDQQQHRQWTQLSSSTSWVEAVGVPIHEAEALGHAMLSALLQAKSLFDEGSTEHLGAAE